MHVSSKRFAGQTIVVTGAARGIGEAVMRLLLNEGAVVEAIDCDGARLAFLQQELNISRPAMRAHQLDISDAEAVTSTIATIERDHEIDGLVNAAGIMISGPLLSLSPKQWQDTFNVNTHGTFYISQCVATHMLPRGRGAIVSVASNAASTPRVGMAAYCASKAGTAMLTRCLGLELGRHGIRCNVVSPGSTNTPMLWSLNDENPEQRRRLIEGDGAIYRTGIPLQKIAEPIEIARGIAFLLSDEASHITLHDLTIDGGATFN